MDLDRLEKLEIDSFVRQAENLAILAQSPHWSAFTDLLKEMRRGALEELAVIDDPAEFRYWQGVAHSINEIIERPERVIAEAAALRDQEESETGRVRDTIRALTRATGDDL